MTTVCIHQPDFMPWLGFFHRLRMTDIYIVLDDVQFIRRGWQHRDKIKTPTGAQWLTVPVHKKGRFHQLIRDTEIDNDTDWPKVHLATLRASYGRAPFFDTYMPALERVYGTSYRYLIDLNMALIRFFLDVFRLKVDIRLSSELGHGPNSRASGLLLELVRSVQGDVYLTGHGSADYLDSALFEAADVEIRWQTFAHPIYPQLHGTFEPNLSSIDAVMNVGAASADLICV